jgi:hypothetical protein
MRFAALRPVAVDTEVLRDATNGAVQVFRMGVSTTALAHAPLLVGALGHCIAGRAAEEAARSAPGATRRLARGVIP